MTRSRSMLPREHGAYAQLGLPLVAALAGSHASIASILYALAACAAFVAHEPALVLLGHRGSRARRESARPARLWLAATLIAAIVLGALAFALSPASRATVWLPAALAIAAVAIALRHQERSLVGEIVAALALASAAVPAAVAGGIAWQDAIALWGVLSAAFLVSTVEVRSVARRPARPLARVATWGVAITIIAGVALARPLLALAPLPIVAVVAYVVVRAPAAAALRRVGWTLAASSLLTAFAGAAALRLAHPALPSTLGDASTGAYTTR